MSVKNIISSMKLFSTDEPRNVEVEPGLFIERRRLLWLPVLAAAALVSPKLVSAAGKIPMSDGTKTWDEFTKECLPTAVELHKDTTGAGQDAYLYWIASKAAQLDLATVPEAKVGALAGLKPKVEFGLVFVAFPFLSSNGG